MHCIQARSHQSQESSGSRHKVISFRNRQDPGTKSSVSGIVRIQARSHQSQESSGSRHGVISLRNRQGPGTDSSVSAIVRIQALTHQSQESSGSRHGLFSLRVQSRHVVKQSIERKYVTLIIFYLYHLTKYRTKRFVEFR